MIDYMVIARRILGFAEQLPNKWNNIPDDTGGRVTMPELAGLTVNMFGNHGQKLEKIFNRCSQHNFKGLSKRQRSLLWQAKWPF